MKHHVVLFSPTGAKVITTPDVAKYIGAPNVAIDPDLTAVKGLPPHRWALQEGRVVETSATEINSPPIVISPAPAPVFSAKQISTIIGITLLVQILVHFLVK